MITKTCTHCKENKLLKYFSKNKLTKDGYNFWCKNCLWEARRNWRKAKKNIKFRGYCLFCDKELYAEKKIKYCNNTCQSNHMFKGKKKVYKMYAWNKGTKGICKPNKSSFKKGFHYNSETEFKKGQYAKDNHFNWRGGISKEPYPFNFDNELKELVKRRDNYTCKMCKIPNDCLSVHHIDYNKKNSNPDNLISLCKSCHGKTNYNRYNWITFFSNKGGDAKLSPNVLN